MFFKTQPTITSSSMTFDVLRSCIETFASKASNELESDVKGCERLSIIEPAARTRNEDRIPRPGLAMIRNLYPVHCSR